MQSAIVFSMSKSDYHYLENPRGEKHRAWNFLMTKRQKPVNKLIKLNELTNNIFYVLVAFKNISGFVLIWEKTLNLNYKIIKQL